MQYIVAIFFILHGLVHLLYVGHSKRFYELVPGFAWSDDSLVFSKWLSTNSIRRIAEIINLLAAVAFVVAGIHFIYDFNWLHADLIVASIMSSLSFILFWDGRLKGFANQGAIGVLINIAIATIMILEV